MDGFEEFAKPSNARMRKPEGMEKGKEYQLECIAREKNRYPNKTTNADIFKALAVYKDFDMLFYTYMPYEYNDKDLKWYQDVNEKIKDKENVRIVFYGKLNNVAEMELLLPHQDKNNSKLHGIQKIAELEAQAEEPSPKKFKPNE